MSGISEIFSGGLKGILTTKRKQELTSLQETKDLPMQNLLTTEERNRAKRAKRFRKADKSEQMAANRQSERSTASFED